MAPTVAAAPVDPSVAPAATFTPSPAVDPALAGRSLFFNAANPGPVPTSVAVPSALPTPAPVPVAPPAPAPGELSALAASTGLFFNPDNLSQIQQELMPPAPAPDDTTVAAPGVAGPAPVMWDSVRQIYTQTNQQDRLVDSNIEHLYEAEEDAETSAQRTNEANLIAGLHQGTATFYSNINPPHDPFANVHNPFPLGPAKKKKKKKH